MINNFRPKEPEPKPQSDQEKMDKQKEYQEKYNKDLKTYGMLSKIDESQKYLQVYNQKFSEQNKFKTTTINFRIILI